MKDLETSEIKICYPMIEGWKTTFEWGFGKNVLYDKPSKHAKEFFASRELRIVNNKEFIVFSSETELLDYAIAVSRDSIMLQHIKILLNELKTIHIDIVKKRLTLKDQRNSLFSPRIDSFDLSDVTAEILQNWFEKYPDESVTAKLVSA